MENNECAPRKHDYEFKGNKTFTTVTVTPISRRVRMSVRAVYKCKTCGKVRNGPPVHGEAGDSLI